MSRKVVRLSVIVEAIEETFDGWEQFYNTATGEVDSLPDPDNSFAGEDDLEEKYEEIKHCMIHVDPASIEVKE